MLRSSSRQQSRRPPRNYGAFMMTSDSELEEEDERRSYITSDAEAKQNVIKRARTRQSRVMSALSRNSSRSGVPARTVDMASRRKNVARRFDGDSSDSDSDNQECDVPDEPSSRSRAQAPSSSAAARRTPDKRGGAQFQLPYGPIPIDDTSRPSTPAPPTATASTTQSQSTLPQMRSVQIRRNVKRMRADQECARNGAGARRGCHGVDLDDLILDEATDRTRLSACIADYLRTMRQNPYYRYAIAVAVAAGHKSYPTYYISSESKEILRILDPTSGGNRQRYQRNSSNDMRQLAETLRSAAYMLRGHIERPDLSQFDGLAVKRQRISARDLSSSSSSSTASNTASRLINSVLNDMASIHAEHARLRDVLRNAHPSAHRQIYLDDKLTPFVDEAMDELYERGVSESLTAHDLIMSNDRLMNLFARLTAQVINTTVIASGDRPITQAHQMAVGEYKEKYTRNILDYLRQNGMLGGPMRQPYERPASAIAPLGGNALGAPLPRRNGRSLAAMLRRR